MSTPETIIATNWGTVSGQLNVLNDRDHPLVFMFSDYLLLLLTLQERIHSYTLVKIMGEEVQYSRQDIYGSERSKVWANIFEGITSGHSMTSGLLEAFCQYFNQPEV